MGLVRGCKGVVSLLIGRGVVDCCCLVLKLMHCCCYCCCGDSHWQTWKFGLVVVVFERADDLQ